LSLASAKLNLGLWARAANARLPRDAVLAVLGHLETCHAFMLELTA